MLKQNLKDLISQARENMGVDAARIIANDLKIENWDDNYLKGSCPFHVGDSSPSFIWYKDGNCFKCFGCGKTYNIVDHYIEYHGLTFIQATEKLFENTKVDYKFSERGAKTKKYRYPSRKVNQTRNNVEDYFSKRAISKETLDSLDIQETPDGKIIAFHFYDENDTFTVAKYRWISKKDFFVQKDTDSRNILFNMNRINFEHPLVIVEGEIDCASVVEAGYKNVVSIPFGAGTNKHSWLEECFQWLENFQKIIIWFDNDKAGSASRKEAISRLGQWRCSFVDLPNKINKNGSSIEVKDANDVLVNFGKELVLSMIQNSVEMPVEGIMDLADADDFNPEEQTGVFSHIKPLDNIIYKFFHGTVVAVTGPPGGGKSTLINQIFVAEPLNQGYDVTIFSGELPPHILKNWVEVTMAGRENVSLKESNKFVRVISVETKTQIREWYRGRIHVYNDDDDNSIDSILSKAELTVRKNGSKVLILDNLATIGIGDSDANTLIKQREMIVKLKNFARKFNILVVLVAHPRKPQGGSVEVESGYDMAGSSDIFNLVHYVFSVRRYSEKERKGEAAPRGGGYKKGKEPIPFDTKISIFKNRLMGAIGTVNLYFDSLSYRFYTSTKELYKRYNWDKNQSPMPMIDPNPHGVEAPDYGEDEEDE